MSDLPKSTFVHIDSSITSMMSEYFVLYMIFSHFILFHAEQHGPVKLICAGQVRVSQSLHGGEPNLRSQVFRVQRGSQSDAFEVRASLLGHLLLSKCLTIGFPRLGLHYEHAAWSETVVHLHRRVLYEPTVYIAREIRTGKYISTYS